MEGKDNAFLSRAQEVGTAVKIKIQTVQESAGIPVRQGALGAVAVRKEDQPAGAGRRFAATPFISS